MKNRYGKRTKEAADSNCVKKEMDAGKPQDQAVAICMNKEGQKLSQLNSQARFRTSQINIESKLKKK